MSAVIYTRISRDRTGAGLGVARQERECRELADRLGLTVADVYADNDLSAYSGKPRPGYLRMLDDITAGRVSHVLMWHTDRLHRANSELETYISTIQAAEGRHGIHVANVAVQAGRMDLNSPGGRANARFLATMAAYESDIKRERIRAKVAEKVSNGEFHGGRRRFGYNRDMSALDEAEAAIIRRMAQDIIKGRSLHSLAEELNAAGVAPPMWKGVPFAMSSWTGSNLGTMLRRPHLAGLRVHGTDPVTNRPVIAGEGNWPPVLDRATWETMMGVFGQAGRRTSPVGTARKHLLPGLIKCGVCGSPLRARPGNGPGKPPAYACPNGSHVHRSRDLVEAVVVGAVVGRISLPGFAAAFLPAEDNDRATLEARIETIEDELGEWTERRMNGTATRRQEEKATAIGMAEIARLRGLLGSLSAAARVPVVLDGLAGNPDAAAVWDGLDLDRRRAVIDAVCDVTLERAARKGAPFDPESVVIRWKTSA